MFLLFFYLSIVAVGSVWIGHEIRVAFKTPHKSDVSRLDQWDGVGR